MTNERTTMTPATTFTFEGNGLVDPNAPEGTLNWHKDTVFSRDAHGATAVLKGIGSLTLPTPAEGESSLVYDSILLGVEQQTQEPEAEQPAEQQETLLVEEPEEDVQPAEPVQPSKAARKKPALPK